MKASLAGLVLLAAVAAFAPAGDSKKQPKKPPTPVYRDPSKADADFAIQGEYHTEGDSKGSAAQVIARGGGLFDVNILTGGLPGAGGEGVGKFAGRLQAKAKTEDGKTTLSGKLVSGTITGGKLELTLGGGRRTLTKVIRRSRTEGAMPPPGAVILTDGKTADQWNNGALWNGLLVCRRYATDPPGGPGGNLLSKKAFKDCAIHLEFRLPYMPHARGQGRANSGLFIQDRYELQILDSFGLKGENNECGGFYSFAKPALNMCYPPLQWQTYDIDFQAARFDGDKKVANARVTVRHNGVVIHENLEMPGPLPGGQKERDTPGPLQLQDHGDPLMFRNIWVLEKK
ncbi:MAG: DUF1080 domain-containing protein [Gemmataceae bacterium]|nr:DUF1080 domain-containing protein [Gemmataceae bacterium]